MDSTDAAQRFLPSSGNRIEDDHPPSQRIRVVSREEGLRLLKIMKIRKKRNPPMVDNDPPIYKEDLERESEEQTKKYVGMALDHYNATTEGPKYELVEAIDINGVVYAGLWYHVCFTAKPISNGADANTDTEASPEHFFGEIAYHLLGEENAISCRIVDINSPDTIDGCGSCFPNVKMYHPKGGFRAGDWPFHEPADIPVPEGYYDDSVPMERRVKFCM